MQSKSGAAEHSSTRKRVTSAGVDFAKVLQRELEEIERRRNHTIRRLEENDEHDNTTPASRLEELREIHNSALEKQLFGVAFSGGGIRSATFNLGVLQRLARHGLLRHIDYLSTVSGGGYIGSWLTSWIAREGLRSASAPGESVLNVEKQLPPSRVQQSQANRWLQDEGEPRQNDGQPGLPRGTAVDREPEAIYHLRAYSNYLAPKVGFLSADSWTLVAIYLRNVLLVQLMLYLFGLALVLVTRAIIWLFTLDFGEIHMSLVGWTVPTTSVVVSLVAVCVVLSFGRISIELNRMHDATTTAAGISERSLHFWILGPLGIGSILVAAMFTSSRLEQELSGMSDSSSLRLPHGYQSSAWASILPEGIRPYLTLKPSAAAWDAVKNGEMPWEAAFTVTIGFCVIHGLINATVFFLSVVGKGHRTFSLRAALYTILAGFGSGAVGGFLLFVVLAKLLWPLMGQPYSAAAIATCGPPLVLAAFVAGAFSEVGLLGNEINEAEREWWSRVCAWCLIYGVCWLAVFGISLFGFYSIEWLTEHYYRKIVSAATFSWVATTVGGLLAGKSSVTKDGSGNRAAELLGAVAPYVFIVGLSIFVSWTASVILNPTDASHVGDRLTDFWLVINHPDRIRALIAAGVILLLGALLIWRVDVNIFSLNALYTNRLVRCYLGASRQKQHWDDFNSGVYRGGAPTGSKGPTRHENAVTGLDAADDFPLRELQIGDQHGKRQLPVYWGPFPIINVALNLVAGTELAWQERKAESFVLTPLYCGSRSTGYQRLQPAADQRLTLGRAISISGAAASPNMGYHTSPALMALMTVFNVRLGWWLQNPHVVEKATWEAKGPPAGSWLLKELFGQTDERSSHVYLSDGGHFENLGIYELVRRRCRYIIACDAAADPNYEFEDLAGAIRKVRTDFGIRIELDVHPIRPRGSDLKSDWHCAVGKVRYSDVHGDGTADGILVYIKASLTADEDSDIDNYRAAHHDFPHQTTGDQFFDESQFESYRALGEHIAAKVLGEKGKKMVLPEAELFDCRDRSPALDNLFTRLLQQHMPLPHRIREKLAESAEGYIDLHHLLLREGKDLAAISKSLYGHLLDGPAGIDDSAPIHFACWLFQVLENAWLEMDLDTYGEHPLNRGWLGLLTRWGASDLVQKHWDELQKDFSQGFVDYFQPFVAAGRTSKGTTGIQNDLHRRRD